MIEMLDSPQGIIAARIGGRLGAEELALYTDRLEASLEAREQTHLYVEVDALEGVDWAGVRQVLPRGLAMLGRLARFGRIAIVAEQRWLRWAAKLESALLPHISYETFVPAEREQARAWVEGRSLLPHGPSLRMIETSRPDVLGFELDGKISAIEAKAIARLVDKALQRPGPLRMLGRVKNVRGGELGAVLSPEYLRMKLALLQRLDRYAMVGGPAWLRRWVEAMNPLFKAELRHFEPEEEALAWAWLGAEPKAERVLAA